MHTYTFEYPDIVAMPAPRPRVNRKGGVYMPSRFVMFKHLIQELTAKQLPYYFIYITSPCYVDINISKPTVVQGRNFGDIDNLAKSILDAYTGIVWDDDKRVVLLNVRKSFGKPHITVKVTCSNLEVIK